METERRDLLFVLADEQHLTSADTLMRRIEQEALDQRKGANILSGLAVAALEASRMENGGRDRGERRGRPRRKDGWSCRLGR